MVRLGMIVAGGVVGLLLSSMLVKEVMHSMGRGGGQEKQQRQSVQQRYGRPRHYGMFSDRHRHTGLL